MIPALEKQRRDHQGYLKVQRKFKATLGYDTFSQKRKRRKAVVF